jgi:DNA-directed RNA polymerase III subunit RPC8
MFILTTIVDTVRIPAPLLAHPTLVSVHKEMDRKYPNRVIMDIGLVICRYGNALQVGDGVCVAGDGGAHHEVIQKFVVFRPFVEEVCVGTILKSAEAGIQVSLGFFDDIFIPAYWMLQPNHFEKKSGLWVWTPSYDDDDEEDDDGGNTNQQDEMEQDEEDNRFELEVGAQIRFKVKSINFTRIIKTAKGLQQATTTTTSQSPSVARADRSTSIGSAAAEDSSPTTEHVRKRSTSIDLTSSDHIPATMHIVGSIAEEGLGLTSWWTSRTEGENMDEDEEGS